VPLKVIGWFLGVEVVANRLFGPQPRTSTYAAIWELHQGRLVGEVTPEFVLAFARAARALVTNSIDRDNTLPAEYSVPAEPDVTLLVLSSDAMDVTLWGGQHSAVQVTLAQGFCIHYDDLACSDYAKHAEIDLPSVAVKCLLSNPTAAVGVSDDEPWLEVAEVSSDISVALGLSWSGWRQKAEEQLAYVRAQDAPTRRCPFLYEEDSSGIYLFSCLLPCSVLSAKAGL
jgi:hypothetical protein